MANSFVHNTKVQLVAGAIRDNLDYVAASVDKMPQSEFKSKKYGKEYNLYITGAGTVHEGTQAVPDDTAEVQIPVLLTNFNTSVRLDAWNEIADIEDFSREIAIPKGKLLARTLQKKIVERNIFKNAQAVVSATADFGVLSDAAAALNELSVAGDVVSYMSPTVMGKIAKSGLGQFQPSQAQSELYSKNFLGMYAGADQIQLPILPTITTPSTMPTATISLTPVTDGNGNTIGFEPVTQVSGTGLIPGLIYKASGLKVVDASGIQTEQDYVISVLDASGHIPELRITIDELGTNAPNAWVAAGTTSLTLTAMLDASKTYYVGQVRTRDALCYSSYKFNNLPGSENSDVATVGGVTVKMSKYGDGDNLETLIRLDIPNGAAIWEPRSCVGVYIEKA